MRINDRSRVGPKAQIPRAASHVVFSQGRPPAGDGERLATRCSDSTGFGIGA